MQLKFCLITFCIAILPGFVISNNNVTLHEGSLPNNFLLLNSKIQLYGNYQPIKINDFLYCSVNTLLSAAISEIRTATQKSYQYILAPSEGCINFEVRTTNELYIALNSDMLSDSPLYKIILGGWSNTKSAILTKDDHATVLVDSPNIISNYYYRNFWIEWNNNVIRVGVQGNPRNLMVLNDPNHSKINYIGFAGNGANWNLRKPETTCFSQRSVNVKAVCSL